MLLEYWRAHAEIIGAEMERALENPLRILDSKRPDWQEMFGARAAARRAPERRVGRALRRRTARTATTSGSSSRSRLASCAASTTTRARCSSSRSDALDAAQNALGGGGRYDRLAEEMGGPPTPSIGFGAGIERILLACTAEGVVPASEARVDVFVVDAIGTPDAALLLHELRSTGLAADRAYGNRSVKKQWGAADRSGARWGVMLAPRELEQGNAIVKDLESGEQVEVRRDEVAAWLYTKKEETKR